MEDILFLLGRILFGGFFLYNGIMHFKNLAGNTSYAASKGTPSPKLAVMATGLMIVLGGLGVLLGIYVEVALWLIVIFLVGVSFMMHSYWKVPADQRMMEQVNFTKNMALAGAALMLLYMPEVWAYSLM